MGSFEFSWTIFFGLLIPSLLFCRSIGEWNDQSLVDQLEGIETPPIDSWRRRRKVAHFLIRSQARLGLCFCVVWFTRYLFRVEEANALEFYSFQFFIFYYLGFAILNAVTMPIPLNKFYESLPEKEKPDFKTFLHSKGYQWDPVHGFIAPNGRYKYGFHEVREGNDDD